MNKKSRKQTQNANMTEGNEVKLVLQFMLPLLLGNIFQQLYTMVDSVVVGHYVSATALGSVGTVSSIQFFFLSLCIGLSGGVNVLAAQSYGAGNEQRLKQVIGNSIYVTLAVGALMSVIAIVLSRQVLTWMRVPEQNFADALCYMRIVCGAAIVVAIYNTASQLLRALGDARTPLFMIILSSIVNVILDLVFVVVLKAGVAGVAWATVISQIAATVGSVWIPLRKNEYFKLEKKHMILSRQIVEKIMKIGIPLAIQNAMGSISGVITQSIVNSFGSLVMSAYTACGRVEQILTQPYGSLGVAVANFTAQNVGAKKYDRIHRACRRMSVLIEGFTVLLVFLSFLFGRQMIMAFVNDEQIIRIGSLGLQIVSVSYFFTGLNYIYKAMLNGAGDASFTTVNGLLEIAARILFLFISIPLLGHWGIWGAAIPSALFALSLCYSRYRSGRWKPSR